MGSIKLENKRVLVTGGCGYLGGFLVNALKMESANVFIIDRKINHENNEYEIDITDFEQVNKVINEIKPQIIFHLAALLNRDRDFSIHDKIMAVNYTGTKNLLATLQEINYDNFIFTSTSEIYGDNEAPFHEGQLPKPASVYSLSKCCSEALIETFSRVYEKNYTILRLFNFIGKNMPESFFIPQLIKSLKQDDSFKMTKGEQARDFVYVDDVIQALLLSATKPEATNTVFNVCTGFSTTLKELVSKFKDRIPGNCRVEYGALPYRKTEVWNMIGNNEKIKNMLGFNVNYDIDSIIDKMIT